MDAYLKMLVKLYEETGGKETVDVDFVDLTKREGYFPSIDNIVNHLKTESWVTESRPNILKITHWGIAAARKASSQRPDAGRSLERNTKRLLVETKNLSVLIEEFIADNSEKRFEELRQKLEQMNELLESIRLTR